MSFQHTFVAGTTVWLDPNGRTSAVLDNNSSLTVANVVNEQHMAELLAGSNAENFRLNKSGLEYTAQTDHHIVFGPGGVPIDQGSSSVSSSVSSSTSSSVSSSASSSVSSSVSSSASSSVSSSVSRSVSSSVSSSASASSDGRLKSSIVPLEEALRKLASIRGVGFVWNQDAGLVGKAPGARDIGVIAQDVEDVFPELVSTDKAGYKRVNYNGLVGVLFAAVAELHARVNELERPRALAAGQSA